LCAANAISIQRKAPGERLVCPVSETTGNSARFVRVNCAVSSTRLAVPVLVMPICMISAGGPAGQSTPKSTLGVKLIGGRTTVTFTACVALSGGWPLSRTTGWRRVWPTWVIAGVHVTTPFVGLMLAPGTLVARLNVRKLVGMSKSSALLVKRNRPPAKPVWGGTGSSVGALLTLSTKARKLVVAV